MFSRLSRPVAKRFRNAAYRGRYRYEKARGRQRLARSRDTTGTIGKHSLVNLLANPAPTILDVGAHVGLDSIEFALLYPDGHIYAFEADERNFLELANATRCFPNIKVVHGAVSDCSGVVSFFGSSGVSNGSGSILTPTKHLERHPLVTFDLSHNQVVPSITLDQFFAESHLKQVDLLWMDVQGAELLVARGATSLLPRVRYIYAEVSMEPMYSGGATYDELRTFLGDYGFTMMKEFLPPEWSGEGNVLFSQQDTRHNCNG